LQRVANPTVTDQVPRVCGVRLELLLDTLNKAVERFQVVTILTPDVGPEFLAAGYAPSPAEEVLHELELVRRQCDFGASLANPRTVRFLVKGQEKALAPSRPGLENGSVFI
jgi:hypothetical protein